jgi:hypothetical protein
MWMLRFDVGVQKQEMREPTSTIFIESPTQTLIVTKRKHGAGILEESEVAFDQRTRIDM